MNGVNVYSYGILVKDALDHRIEFGCHITSQEGGQDAGVFGEALELAVVVRGGKETDQPAKAYTEQRDYHR